MSALKVAFVWHMHQPWYVWPGTNRAALPFARLHGYGSYYDMPWLVRQFEQTKVTFNLVPSLAEQIIRYSQARLTDRPLELCRRSAADLEPDDQVFLLTHFVGDHPDRMAELSPRFAQLAHKRGLRRNGERMEKVRGDFSEADYRDLQVWFNLACCGYGLRHDSDVVRQLWAKDCRFTEDDKRALLDELEGALARVLPLFGAARGDGHAELSTSPYFHPILPLLCNMSDAMRCTGRERLPDALWQAPEEAERQLQRALNHHTETFGGRPSGLWPPEGAVSDRALELVSQMGFAWTASDEEILAHSLQGTAGHQAGPYRPYGVVDGNLAIVFRDRYLSDHIGFVYRDWAPADAAADFIGRLLDIASGLSHLRKPGLVCAILDGENPWGTYPDGGEGFLRALYAGIEAEPGLETTSLSEYLAEHPPDERLDAIFPGSWIDHCYETWIGGEEHRRAWHLLHNARQSVEQAAPSSSRAAAREHLMVAEGSDWFWWYSDAHHSEYESVFDELFRSNVAAVHRALGEPEPEALAEPIAVVGVGVVVRQPAGYMTATLDGRITSYFEWQAAGLLRTSALASAMHRSHCVVREVYFGFDAERLWLRVDVVGRARSIMQTCDLQFLFPGQPERVLLLRSFDREAQVQPVVEGQVEAAAAVDSIVEVAADLGLLGSDSGNTMEFAVALQCQGKTLERWPQRGFLRLEVPSGDSLSSCWLV